MTVNDLDLNIGRHFDKKDSIPSKIISWVDFITEIIIHPYMYHEAQKQLPGWLFSIKKGDPKDVKAQENRCLSIN